MNEHQLSPLLLTFSCHPSTHSAIFQLLPNHHLRQGSPVRSSLPDSSSAIPQRSTLSAHRGICMSQSLKRCNTSLIQDFRDFWPDPFDLDKIIRRLRL